MTFATPLPWWAVASVLAAAVLLAWHVYRAAPLSNGRRFTLAALRVITLVTIVLLLMRPLSPGGAEPGDAVVLFLVDTSRSMGIEDVGGARRIDHARTILVEELLPALTPHFPVEVLGFGEALAAAAPETLTASARQSDVAGALAALQERYRGRAVAGVVLLSDGGETPVPDGGSRTPAAEHAPVFPIAVGSTSITGDREVLSVTVAEAVLDEARVDIAAAAVSHGYGSAAIELRLLENGRPIDLRRIAPAASGSPVHATFQVEPGTGAPTIYTVEIPAAAGELVPENNTRSVLVQPPSRPRRVLLMQGAPGYEHSFLRRAWSGDPGLEIDSVVRQGRNDQGADTFYIQASPARSAALATGYPASRQDLFAYDAVVLANVEGSFLSNDQLQATRDFVSQRGGGLLVLGAQSFLRGGLVGTPLEEALPLDRADRGGDVLPAAAVPARAPNRVRLTPQGEAHPVMQLGRGEETRKRWDAVPALAATAPLGGPRPGASVLAVTGGAGGGARALVAVQRYGEGRTMVFTGEAAWRWRMLLPASDRSYDTFWRQALRWIALPAVDPVTVTTPAGAAAGEAVGIGVMARSATFEALPEPEVEIRVTRPDGRVDSLVLARDGTRGTEGLFSGRYRAEMPGVHRVTADVREAGGRVTTAAKSILVGGADLEMADPRVNLPVLQRLAAASGGRMVTAGETSVLLDSLRAGIPAATRRLQRDLWHTGWSFAAILNLLALEWILRRRWGLR